MYVPRQNLKDNKRDLLHRNILQIKVHNKKFADFNKKGKNILRRSTHSCISIHSKKNKSDEHMHTYIGVRTCIKHDYNYINMKAN